MAKCRLTKTLLGKIIKAKQLNDCNVVSLQKDRGASLMKKNITMKFFKAAFVTLMIGITALIAGLFVLVTGYAAQLWFPIAPVPEALEIYEPGIYVLEGYNLEERYLEYIPYEPEIMEPPEEATTLYGSRKPMVAITFDDGPGRFTNGILDLLYEHDARATFFVLGYRVERYPDIVARAAERGNEIANHSWSHMRLSQANAGAIYNEIIRTSAAITSVAGASPPIMRPPYGRAGGYVRFVAEDLGYSLVNWTLDTLDWRYRDANRIYNTIMNEVKDGSVILLHDIHATTAEAMERVIPRLIEEGYQLVTVSELLTYFYGSLEPGRIYGRIFDIE